MLTYIQAYDEFEVRANSLYNKLEQLYVFTSLQNYPSVNIDGQYGRLFIVGTRVTAKLTAKHKFDYYI